MSRTSFRSDQPPSPPCLLYQASNITCCLLSPCTSVKDYFSSLRESFMFFFFQANCQTNCQASCQVSISQHNLTKRVPHQSRSGSLCFQDHVERDWLEFIFKCPPYFTSGVGQITSHFKIHLLVTSQVELSTQMYDGKIGSIQHLVLKWWPFKLRSAT